MVDLSSKLIPEYPDPVWIIGTKNKAKDSVNLPLNVVIREWEDNQPVAVVCFPVYCNEDTVTAKISSVKESCDDNSTVYVKSLTLDAVVSLAKSRFVKVDLHTFVPQIEAELRRTDKFCDPSSIPVKSGICFQDNESLDVMFLD